MVRSTGRVDIHVGARLLEARKHRGVTRQELAVTVGISYQQLAKYELGENRIGVARLYDFAVALEHSIDYFFAGLPPPVSGDTEYKGKVKSRARIRIEELATSPIGRSIRFPFGSFTSPNAVKWLVNKVGGPSWADITPTPTGITIEKVAEPQ